MQHLQYLLTTREVSTRTVFYKKKFSRKLDQRTGKRYIDVFVCPVCILVPRGNCREQIFDRVTYTRYMMPYNRSLRLGYGSEVNQYPLSCKSIKNQQARDGKRVYLAYCAQKGVNIHNCSCE